MNVWMKIEEKYSIFIGRNTLEILYKIIGYC